VTLGIGAGFSGDPTAGWSGPRRSCVVRQRWAWTTSTRWARAAGISTRPAQRRGADLSASAARQRPGRADRLRTEDDQPQRAAASPARGHRFTRAWRAGHLELAEILAADQPSAQQPGNRAAGRPPPGPAPPALRHGVALANGPAWSVSV
jgi:hypothetical protein